MLFPLIPAMIMISNENANDRLKTLKSKSKDNAKPSVVEESDVLYGFINETRQGQLYDRIEKLTAKREKIGTVGLFM